MSSTHTPSSRSSAESVHSAAAMRLEHRFRNFKARAVGAGDRALQRAAGAGGNVQLDFKPRADHAHRIEDSRLLIEDELARKQMKNLAIRGQLNGAGAIDGGAHILAR